MEQYSVTEGDGLVEVCVQFVELSDDTEDMLWENVPVTIATVPIQSLAVGEYTIITAACCYYYTMHAHKGIQLCNIKVTWHSY